MTVQTKQTICSFIGAAWLAIATTLFLGLYPKLHNRESRHAVAAIMEQLSLGDSPGKVREVCGHHQTSRLRLVECHPQIWIIEMEREWSCPQWNVRVCFKGDRVASLRVCDADGLHPYEAPKDKGRDFL